MGLKSFRKKLWKAIEKTLISFVDLAVFVNQKIESWYIKNYMPKFSTTVVYNSPEKIKIKKNVDIFRHLNFVRNNKPIILYQGFLSLGRGIENLIDNIKKNVVEDYNFVFMGYGPLEELLKKTSKEIKNIIYVPPVDPQNYLFILHLQILV